MDPLSLVANVITVLQAANSIITMCYECRAAVRKAPWSLTKVLEEMRDLRAVLESLMYVAERCVESPGRDYPQLRALDLLCDPNTGPLTRCEQELLYLEKKIKPCGDVKKRISKPRALLQVMRWQLKENEAKAILKRIERCKITIALAMTADEMVLLAEIKDMTAALETSLKSINDNVSCVLTHFQNKERDQREKAITHWLAPVDPWENYDAAVGIREPGTGKWLLESKNFIDWHQLEKSFLWLSGFPGSGKTILFSNVILLLTSDPSLVSARETCAFFYCDFRKRELQNAIDVVCSLVAQLYSQLKLSTAPLGRAFDSTGTSIAPSKKPPFSLLRNALCSISKSQRILLLIDAVDECKESGKLLDFLVSLNEEACNIRVLITSRDEVGIRQKLGNVKHIQMEDYITNIDEDINLYISHRLRSEHRLQWLSSSVKNDIKVSLTTKSAGMFRLAHCTLDAISSLRTVRSIRSALKELPTELGKLYENILIKLPSSDEGIVRRILLWLSFSVLPVTLEELRSAIAIEQGVDQLDEESYLGNAQDILEMCGSLINMTEDGQVRLAHMSVKDYLLSQEIRNGPASAFALDIKDSNRELAVACFTYLSFQDLQSGPCQSAEAFAARLTTYPFLRHASTAWTYYLRGCESSAQLDENIFAFFSPDTRGAFMSWVQVLNADSNFKWDLYSRHATSLYYAASFGLLHVVKNLIAKGSNVNEPGSRFGGTPLHGAILRYHIDVAETLLKEGALPNKADFNGVTPLHTAATCGHVESIKLLLEYGASKEIKDMGGETPLVWAIKAGHSAARKLLEGELAVEEECMKIGEKQFWIRSHKAYFPNWYDRRSGLESSIVVAVTVGENSFVSDTVNASIFRKV